LHVVRILLRSRLRCRSVHEQDGRDPRSGRTFADARRPRAAAHILGYRIAGAMHECSFRGVAGTIALLGASLGVGCSNAPTAPTRFGPPTALQIVTGNAQTGDENLVLPFPLTVQVLDTAGRGVPGVQVDWSVTRGGGTVLARAFPTVTDSTGLVVVFWQLGSSLTLPQRLVATCCGGVDAVFSAQAVLPLAQRVSISGWSFDFSFCTHLGTVTQTLATPIVAQVLGADGTPDVGAIVGWGTHSPGGHFSPTFSRADSTGHASTRWTLGTVAGAETSWASVRGLPPAFAVACATAGPPVRMAIAPRTLPPLVIGDTVRVRGYAWDQYGNFVTWVPSRAADTTIVRATPDSAFVQATHHGTTWLNSALGAIRDSVAVTVLGFSAVSDGGDVTCGVSLAGDVFCWGVNAEGAIGDGTTLDRFYPVLVGQGLDLQLPYSNWQHTCSLTASGQAYCWGLDQSGELGDGSPNYATELRQTLPVAVAGGHIFTSIRAGNTHTCAVATNGDAYCWGDNNSGQLGRDTLTGTCIVNNSNRCSNWPILVTGGLTFTQVSAGPWDHSCGVTTSGAAYCWGQGASGQLGTASPLETCVAGALPPFRCSHTPRLVQGAVVFKAVTAGNNFSCGLDVSGDGYCWGYGNSGELGNGGTVSSAVPGKVSGGVSFADIQAGEWNACGLATTGRVYCWGGSYGATPAPVRPDLTFGALAVGGSGGTGHTCALTTDHDLYCWYSRP